MTNLHTRSPRICRSPLRYPGGKQRALRQILRFFPERPGVVVSPFFGGGSVELALAACGWRVIGYDLFEPLVDFWQAALTDPVALADAAERFLPLDKQTFRYLQSTRFHTAFEQAVAFFVLNRSSYSGATMSGGMSRGHPRFNQSCIKRLRHFETGDVWVEQADFPDSLAAHPDALVFADPPYPNSKGLYGKNGDMHDGFDHLGLCQILRSRSKWILTYGDCPEVRQMYDGYTVVALHWQYGMPRSDKRSREVLVLSHDLADHARNVQLLLGGHRDPGALS